jgi:hypothetical protein
MKNILNYRNKVDKELVKCFDHLIEKEKGLHLSPYLKKLSRSEKLSTRFLAKSVLGFIESTSNTHFLFENNDSEVENLFIEFTTHNDKSYLFDYKRKLENENDKFLESHQLSDYKDFLFERDDLLLKDLNLVDFYTSLCDAFRLKKFRYVLDECYPRSKSQPIGLDVSFNIYDAFPDANKRFSKFIENRVSLFYLNFLLDQTKTVEQNEEKNIGNLDLFKPGSEFSKIFNDQNEIPKFIYDFLKGKTDKFFTQANLNRLRNILQHSKYENHVLIKANQDAGVTFTNVTGKFIGKDYKYKDESLNQTDLVEEIVEDLKKISDFKQLTISYNHT